MESIVRITAMCQLICSFMDQDDEMSFNLVAKNRVCKLKFRPINSCDYTRWSLLKDMSNFVFLPSSPEQIRIAFSEHSIIFEMLRRNWFSSEQQTFSFFLYFKYFKNICLRTATHTGLRLFLLCHVFLPASRHTQSGSRSLWLRSTNIFQAVLI